MGGRRLLGFGLVVGREERDLFLIRVRQSRGLCTW
jgi:hypothetical protein